MDQLHKQDFNTSSRPQHYNWPDAKAKISKTQLYKGPFGKAMISILLQDHRFLIRQMQEEWLQNGIMGLLKNQLQ